MKLIVGLGNPGTKYNGTRHNVGFAAVDYLAGGDAVWKSAHDALVAKEGDTLFAKPQTFMNLSGGAVRAIMAFYKIPLENVTVIHDDMDLPVGTVREKVGGGSAGHNGIKSIDAAVGNDYRRIRIGVGRPENAPPTADAEPPLKRGGHIDWVLGKFTPDEKSEITRVIESIVL
ncbi:MAG: aminoacyl-tRNA hydrolase [Rickettsiales bacterium]|jgi:PTH1 family peptidyl-tRNA hydrolase|nr:aminoacyl-tRNA hydrolase [Rickettsiales bacterium]